MVPSAISRLYYLGLALSLGQLVCACVNVALLPPTDADVKDTGKADGEDKEKQLTSAGYLEVLVIYAILTCACWFIIIFGSRRSMRLPGRAQVGSIVWIMLFSAFQWIYSSFTKVTGNYVIADTTCHQLDLLWKKPFIGTVQYLAVIIFPVPTTPVGALVASCAAIGFRGMGCTAVGVHIFLPLANVATIICAACKLYHRAKAIHGSAQVEAPPPPPAYAAAWTLAYVVELDLPVSGTKAETV
ncbi:hypothetical protein DFH09DRAFT_1309614 [Mycena vulgaris]|nr:hypothetical protein DFH09DRAFT_1309614 [Mycena vulgaris]